MAVVGCWPPVFPRLEDWYDRQRKIESVQLCFVVETSLMPLYEYSCEQCGKKIELLVRGGEQPECPHCQSTQLTKLLSVVAGHVAGGSDTAAMESGCGRPQCGMGGCAGLG